MAYSKIANSFVHRVRTRESLSDPSIFYALYGYVEYMPVMDAHGFDEAIMLATRYTIASNAFRRNRDGDKSQSIAIRYLKSRNI